MNCDKKPLKVFIAGDGGWGTANALLLAGYGHDVTVWGADAAYVREIALTRANTRYLPGVDIPDRIKWTTELSDAAGADVVVFATPSRYFEDVCFRFRSHVPADALVVSLAKGFCERTHVRMTVLAEKALGRRRIVALSGPSHAEEVGRHLPTTVSSSSEDREAAELVQRTFMNDRFRVYTNTDVRGVEICGALKNIIALAAGISAGLGYGDNTKAALITRGLAEIERLGIAMGCQEQTFSGLAGMGDLIVTATSKHSRNNRCGYLIGQGYKPADAA